MCIGGPPRVFCSNYKNHPHESSDFHVRYRQTRNHQTACGEGKSGAHPTLNSRPLSRRGKGVPTSHFHRQYFIQPKRCEVTRAWQDGVEPKNRVSQGRLRQKMVTTNRSFFTQPQVVLCNYSITITSKCPFVDV